MKKINLTLILPLLLVLAAGFGYYRHLTSADFRMVLMMETPEVVALRIKLGADVRQPDSFGNIPLYYALNKYDHLGRNAIRSINGGSELRVESKRASDADVVRMLLDAGAEIHYSEDVDQDALLMAVNNGDCDTVSLLLSRGANVNVMDNNQNSALAVAARVGIAEIVDLLLSAGADPNISNEDGYSALMVACEDGEIPIIESLLLAGAHTDMIAKDGRTLADAALNDYFDKVGVLHALMKYAKTPLPKPVDKYLLSALLDRDEALVSLLLKCGANPNARDHDDSFPPLISLIIGDDMNMAIIANLIDAGADVNVQDKDGETPLTMSISQKKPKATALLIAAGADLNLDGKTSGSIPLHEAVQYRNLELVSFLLSKGANPNVYDRWGRTALHAAFALNLEGSEPPLELIELLLKSAANSDIKDKHGDPFCVAPNEEILKLIKRYSKASSSP